MGPTSKKLVGSLVVDTTAFIQNAQLQDVAETIITCPEVIAEITNKRQLRRLVVLPYDLVVKEAFPENVKVVTDFSKKTGDYPSLSATDIKVMALTYQLEKEKVGTDHIRVEPVRQGAVVTTENMVSYMNPNIAGFYVPGRTKNIETKNEVRESNDAGQIVDEAGIKEIDTVKEEIEGHTNAEQELPEIEGHTDSKKNNTIEEQTEESSESSETDSEDDLPDLIKDSNEDEDQDLYDDLPSLEFVETANKSDDVLVPVSSNESEETDQDLYDDLPSLEFVETANKPDDVLVPVSSNESEETDEDESSEETDEDDGVGWITPSNVKQVRKQVNSELLEEKQALVACMTTDFAMQNVLRQMNLSVSTLDGRLIKQLRTYILRCYTCFKTTSIMTKKFCPKCGNNTLKKVAVSLDENGKMQIHINPKRPLTARGKKFSLPRIKGGKHPNNPILVDDQPMPDNKPTRLARMKNNPMEDEYIAGVSPFLMRDITSKSAQLCIRPGQEFKYWMRKNPNEARRKRK